ncbi:hypothetical protein Athai_57340 [Actinocatenispora thailandica]|uniref:DUF4190 domain-containing protein n=1 Tax=Actinocatenispora thailandica TaxID=227318 RepID=A0A7R7DV59_9ACTN|nr:hypothetical protein [Actinocatenispora thailandica]BCJ38231.1 hypothetical protein Athai_57340 [Actinocatenispora thailandica]
MTDPNGGGFNSGDEPVTHRLPLRNTTQTAPRPGGAEPWRADAADEDNPFAGTALGGLPDRGSPANPFATPAAGSPSALDLNDDERRKARTSFPITIGLICTVAGATLGVTEVLARVGAVVGAFGILLSVIGLFSARRAHVGGRLVAVLSIVIGLAAVGIAVVDHFGTFTWLNADLPKHLANKIDDYVPFLS